jgi:flagellar biogenesis protein FliO
MPSKVFKSCYLQFNSPSPVKRTNVEKLVNYQILFMFALLILMAIISVIGFSVWLVNKFSEFSLK